jgi:hypothetical protein
MPHRFARKIAALATLALAIPTATLHAQRTVRIGAAVNTALPSGQFHDSHSADLGALGFITIGASDNSIFGLRLDAAHTRFTGRDDAPNLSITSVRANLIVTLPAGYAKPYLLGGGGWYTYRDTIERKNTFGIQGGLGFTFPFILANGFLEARYHRIFGKDEHKRFIALSAGLVL